MSAIPDPSSVPDPRLHRIFEASHRLLAGLVPGGTVTKLAGRIRDEEDRYPWEEVVESLTAPSVEPQELVQRGLRAQRDWILRSAAGRPMRRLRVATKTLLARIVAQGLFFVLYTTAVIALLLLIRLKWDWFDIYRLLEPIRRLVPGIGGGG